METEHIVICFDCRRRITIEEIRAGKHNHADIEDALDSVVNLGED